MLKNKYKKKSKVSQAFSHGIITSSKSKMLKNICDFITFVLYIK